MAITLNVDGTRYSVDADPNTPLLWVLRDHLNLTGTKFGCGMAMCGACTVMMGGTAIRSCAMPIGGVGEGEIITIHNDQDPVVEKLKKAWVEEDVSQCGYCQPGQIMSAAGLLKSNPQPSDDDIVEAMHGNICRCGTYNRIKTAIKKVAQET
jgi:isoquinoline 1-oxidoreductase alpha subunit